MSPRLRITPEQEAFAKRVASTTARMRVLLVDAATAYVSLEAPDERGDVGTLEQAWDWAERIAVQWREADQAGATDPIVEEDLSSERPHRLLGAIEDSLILTAVGDLDQRSLALPIEETTNRITELDEDGAWDTVDIRRRETPPSGDLDERVARFDQLEMRLLGAVSEAAAFFPRLVPDGRDLTGNELAESRKQLASLAACGRELDRERDLLTDLLERRDLRPSIGVLRSMQHALVLRLSDDPDRRQAALPLPELAERFAPVRKDWTTWE